MKLINDTGSICIDVKVPGPIGRARGLLGTKAPPASGRGILLKGGQIHTFGMRYTIDVVHLDRAGKVINIRSMEPNRLGRRERGTKRVLELADGEAARIQLHKGMSLLLQEGHCP
ncbi:MAG TPA: DUF192 domain-containing protein [Actinomycetota bacterium]|nr:DUF192 domain-containing protein [Actinomycetota bacterium]